MFFLGRGVLNHREEDFYIALCILGGLMLFGIVFTALSFSLRCPLCHATLLRRTGASISSKAQRLFGSFRARIAFGVLLRGHFRCPYCGEPIDAENTRH